MTGEDADIDPSADKGTRNGTSDESGCSCDKGFHLVTGDGLVGRGKRNCTREIIPSLIASCLVPLTSFQRGTNCAAK